MSDCLARRIVCSMFIISCFCAFENTLQFMLVFDVYMPNTCFVRNGCTRRKPHMCSHTHARACASPHTHTHTHTQFEINMKCGVIFFHMFPWIHIQLFICTSVLRWEQPWCSIFTKWTISSSLYVGDKLDECETV
jgi:hypothetical protein